MLITVTAKIPVNLNKKLEGMASKLDRKKSYLIRQAIKDYIEDYEEYLEAKECLEKYKKEDGIKLEDVMRKYGME